MSIRLKVFVQIALKTRPKCKCQIPTVSLFQPLYLFPNPTSEDELFFPPRLKSFLYPCSKYKKTILEITRKLGVIVKLVSRTVNLMYKANNGASFPPFYPPHMVPDPTWYHIHKFREFLLSLLQSNYGLFLMTILNFLGFLSS